jgi:hypothetical protein
MAADSYRRPSSVQDVIVSVQVITSGVIAEYDTIGGNHQRSHPVRNQRVAIGRFCMASCGNQRFEARNHRARTKDPLTQAQY